ncbi:Mrp/NBP35 family ATP-binding protein, partial [Francisella tularensis subsp. holarctica]|uniref:P-loop NTPase n=1 Tax=Francisella tularensis TaxID=263 RepID=UPI002381B627
TSLFDLKQNHNTTDKKKIIPLENYAVKMISIGNLIYPETAVIWRGPIVSRALMQLLNDTDCGDIDYLFLDLHPGTG